MRELVLFVFMKYCLHDLLIVNDLLIVKTGLSIYFVNTFVVNCDR